jgi:hypothetical protein
MKGPWGSLSQRTQQRIPQTVERPRGLKYASEQAGTTEASTEINSWLPARRAYSSERAVLE